MSAAKEKVLPARPDPSAMRRVCSAYATGVAIVSTRCDDGRLCGLTVNSFTSVSLDPPLILWSLSRSSPSLSHFDRDGPFAISILAEDQNELALRFARPIRDKFAEVDHRPGTFGAPIIADSVAHLECGASRRIEAGDHVIFVWQVLAASEAPSRAPLAFHGGAFRSISPLAGARAA